MRVSFSVRLDCTAGTVLTADCMLGLAAQRHRSFDVRLINAGPQLATRGGLLGLNLSDDLMGDYIVDLTGYDVPLAHWLSTFAAMAEGGVTSVSARVATAPTSGCTQAGAISISSTRTTVAARRTSSTGAHVACEEVTLLARTPI